MADRQEMRQHVLWLTDKRRKSMFLADRQEMKERVLWLTDKR